MNFRAKAHDIMLEPNVSESYIELTLREAAAEECETIAGMLAHASRRIADEEGGLTVPELDSAVSVLQDRAAAIREGKE